MQVPGGAGEGDPAGGRRVRPGAPHGGAGQLRRQPRQGQDHQVQGTGRAHQAGDIK